MKKIAIGLNLMFSLVAGSAVALDDFGIGSDGLVDAGNLTLAIIATNPSHSTSDESISPFGESVRSEPDGGKVILPIYSESYLGELVNMGILPTGLAADAKQLRVVHKGRTYILSKTGELPQTAQLENAVFKRQKYGPERDNWVLHGTDEFGNAGSIPVTIVAIDQDTKCSGVVLDKEPFEIIEVVPQQKPTIKEEFITPAPPSQYSFTVSPPKSEMVMKEYSDSGSVNDGLVIGDDTTVIGGYPGDYLHEKTVYALNSWVGMEVRFSYEEQELEKDSDDEEDVFVSSSFQEYSKDVDVKITIEAGPYEYAVLWDYGPIQVGPLTIWYEIDGKIRKKVTKEIGNFWGKGRARYAEARFPAEELPRNAKILALKARIWEGAMSVGPGGPMGTFPLTHEAKERQYIVWGEIPYFSNNGD